jgi:ABC-type lipoprotein release transport system permease subunit
MTAILVKLAFAGIRSRLLASVLTVLLSGAAAATIVLALEVGATARDPWQQTFTAANGAHALANVSTEADARTIAAMPGVAERDEPDQVASAMPPNSAGVDTWQDQRAGALGDSAPARLILTTYTIVLLIVVFAVVAILIGARASAQYREIGLLKAVGLTPRQVTAAFALEAAGLGVIAVAIGFAVGAVLAPQVAAASAQTMLGSPTMAVNPWHLLAASGPVLLVLIGSARSATRRSTRFSALQAIQSGTPMPAPPSRLGRILARTSLPVPMMLGLNDLLARRHRATRLAGAIAVTSAAVVFALCMQASLDARPVGVASDVPDELPLLVYTLDAVLLLITVTTIVAVALLAVRERVREYAVLKTIGLTPGQIASSLLGAHAVMALIAAILSIPLGILLYVVVYGISGGSSEDRVIAPWWWLTLVPIGAVVLVTLATSLPARLATRISTADALRYQ